MKDVRKAVIPAAGLGTRFLPATKSIPKEMLPIGDKPAIQYVVEEAVASGIHEILIVTNHRKSSIEQFFHAAPELEQHLNARGQTDRMQQIHHMANLANIQFVHQPEPLGLGHAVLCAQDWVGNDPFAILLGDCLIQSEIPVLKQLLDIRTRKESAVIAIRNVQLQQVSRSGIVATQRIEDRLHEVIDLVEKPKMELAPSTLAIVGRYVLEPSVFLLLEKAKPGVNGEIQLTDALVGLNQISPLLAYEFQGTRYDIGDRYGYLQAFINFSLADPASEYDTQQILQKALNGYEDRQIR